MIDITLDFRTDSKGRDPDTYSPTLNVYHRALWSNELPNGEAMDLQLKGAPFYTILERRLFHQRYNYCRNAFPEESEDNRSGA